MKRRVFMRRSQVLLLSLSFGLILVLVSYSPLFAAPFTDLTFSWSGLPIEGERDDFYPSGTAAFSYDDTYLTLLLTNDSSQEIIAIGEVLTGLTWDFEDSITLDPIFPDGAVLEDSRLVGFRATSDTDVSTEWFYKDNIDAGESLLGPIGSYGVGTVGDINLGADTFGKWDRFDVEQGSPPYFTGTNLFGPDAPDGIETGIVGPSVDLTADGFPTQGPLVQGNPGGPGQILFKFQVLDGDLDESDITNVQPMFGTDGALLVPEPATLLLLGSGLLGLLAIGRKKFRKS